jgi:hypothetical protein
MTDKGATTSDKSRKRKEYGLSYIINWASAYVQRGRPQGCWSY